MIDAQIQNPSESCVATDGYILPTRFAVYQSTHFRHLSRFTRHLQGIYFGWISWFNPVDFLGDPVKICSLSLGGVRA